MSEARPPITIVIPTFNRPEGLIKAVKSLFTQTLTQQGGFDLVIVDNHPEATADDAVTSLREACPDSIRIKAVHEPRPGIANARNAAMAQVTTDLVAFLDDDMCAPADWLERLLEGYRAHPVAVSFGPVLTALPETQTRHREYFSNFFARDPGHQTGLIDASYGCGNALIDFSKVPGKAPWFDVTMNEMGGEDDRLFDRVRAGQGQFAWIAEAPVDEHPLPSRLKLNYTLRRAFSYGQGPVTLARLADPPRRLDMLKWMMIGAGKAAFHGTLWLGMSAIRHPRRAFQIDQAVRGLGKVIWFLDFHFYGTSQLSRNPLGLHWFKPRPKPGALKADEV
ncbi:glycosyltransferase family 2 protein [Hyphomonas sp. FCG-A18]|uniref:glycosyltransferase family 2 protein n=1 Tax=Hyphomonas sp. FCG-A18 TaxID=3080019 RepID=UPI002B30FE4F|nr:glycosyltransferase family 2 protein [Hyphomonas sp. FCG-A18]